ncbi:outer membrane protein [Methylophilaceae bacterium 11]|uniref:autotransporter assembly complex protein TamA n=1 Tax=Methylotenera sp. 1P/1 TaxID=1131551 RepID=UPI00036297CE|nr:autotransporter assembly complex family protein [Methylotenera sp. 1P/1]EUJ11025.1 outer membrane protein [Methylophilaceae bacterium 11]
MKPIVLITHIQYLKHRWALLRAGVRLLLCVFCLCSTSVSLADTSTLLHIKKNSPYATTFKISLAPDQTIDTDALQDLLKTHLTIHEALENTRLNQAEWLRLVQEAPKEIKELLETEGYFSAEVNIESSPTQDTNEAVFVITPNPRTQVQEVSLIFKGEIAHAPADQSPSSTTLTQGWRLPKGTPFTQQGWSEAKRALLTAMLGERYPNAKIESSQAIIDPETHQAKLNLTVDSGIGIRLGDLVIEGLHHYPESLVRNLNPIESGMPYSQSTLLKLQNTLQETGKFNRVTVSATTQKPNQDGLADVVVNVQEREQQSVSIGVGASTNTGARVVLNYTDRNLFERGLLWDTSLRLEQRLQAATSSIKLMTDASGYRDSINNSLVRTNVEGQITTAVNNGVKRSWGDRNFEQFIGANLLYEFLSIDGESTEFNKAATFAYGLSLRRLDHDLIPTKGVIFSSQFQVAPIERLSDGRFLQSQAKLQGFYPLGQNTQFLGRLEVGVVTGSDSVPATYLFRAGGDQSVRGYAFQALGVKDGDAILGGRVLLTGSTELVQWFTSSWGAAAFVDFGNAANSWHDYRPAYGYGLGVRWKSPVGPVGADIAYGEETKDYRLHFNLGVSF